MNLVCIAAYPINTGIAIDALIATSSTVMIAEHSIHTFAFATHLWVLALVPTLSTVVLVTWNIHTLLLAAVRPSAPGSPANPRVLVAGHRVAELVLVLMVTTEEAMVFPLHYGTCFWESNGQRCHEEDHKEDECLRGPHVCWRKKISCDWNLNFNVFDGKKWRCDMVYIGSLKLIKNMVYISKF